MNPSNGTTGRNIAAMAFNAAGTLFAVRLANNSQLRAADLVSINTSTGAITVLGDSVNNLDAIVFDGGAVAPVPTLSEWGMIGMSTLLAGLGVWAMRRRLVLGGEPPREA